MPLAALEQKLRTLPEQSFAEVDEFFNYILFKFSNCNDECEKINVETMEALKEVEEMKKNPSLGKSYTDVDAMMKDLLA